MNPGLMNKLANQEQYTKQVLLECYKVFLESQKLSKEYLAIDFLFDIQKHFGIELKTA